MEFLVANFDNSTTEDDLTMLLGEFGGVLSIEMVQAEKVRYAVVEMNARPAKRAILDLNGKDWRGRRLVVTESPRYTGE